MNHRNVLLGDTPLQVNDRQVKGEFVHLDGERYYKISNYDQMPHFFISIVSASDQWMFISTNGSLTAGRRNADGALFPYYSEDKIHDYHDKTGSKSLFLVKEGGDYRLWEPFSSIKASVYDTRRNLYKNLYGNKLIFEEVNEDLGLTFRYAWYNSERFGFVRQSGLGNHGSRSREVELLDGVQNVLPAGVDSGLQSSSSNLLDAYKRQELIRDIGLAIYRLSSVPADTAEPSEALKVNTIWSVGLEKPTILLSSLQVDRFRSGFPVKTERDIKAIRGAYLINARLEIAPSTERKWSLVAEVNQDSTAVSNLIRTLEEGKEVEKKLFHQVDQSNEDLKRILASSDALQCTNDELSTSRHLTNVLFNVMRGGIFPDNYQFPTQDFLSFISKANKQLVPQALAIIGSSGGLTSYIELMKKARDHHHAGLIRLCYEYLALTFSRRHGDPSRPWNRFSIESRKEDGTRNLDYEGNWRDIFQNWEALGLSFPEYVESMISKFVNASTADGYNPYRITRNGIDWEVPDPADPWSNIGYWGDHQVIYLLKFLEISSSHHPGLLHQLLSLELFSYANVPYRIKPYWDLLRNPHDTIDFDAELEQVIHERVADMGSDGRLIWDEKGQVFHVNLAEKLLVTLLSKLSNFIPGAGIWMNTQRPEWNDANNALVGYGVSMVTACYMRAFLRFNVELFGSYHQESVSLSSEVARLLASIGNIIREQMQDPTTMLTPPGMKTCMDLLGEAGGTYRQEIYEKGFSGKKEAVKVKQIMEFIEQALRTIDITISSNRREDRLYHAYNLIRVEKGDQVSLRRLYEMLEGQVAVLSSGYLEMEEAVDLLDAMKVSKLFREDQYSYILYPDRELPSFMEINNLSAAMVERSRLLKKLVESANRQIIMKDVGGMFHFNGNFRNAGLLEAALASLPAEYTGLVEKEKQLILEIYEEVFDHQSFTGRSGTFYGYEGLGSIYWHMVSKLLLAVCDTYYRAASESGSEVILGKLAGHYYEIRAGIGLNKDPRVYGAFPTDPYSHTPRNRGAQQPGMTGQVKEDIIARWGELGIRVIEGRIVFKPVLLRREEFLTSPVAFSYYDLNGTRQVIPLEKDTLAFTYCQVPVKYMLSTERKIALRLKDGSSMEMAGDTIDSEHSAMVFRREGTVSRIDVCLNPEL